MKRILLLAALLVAGNVEAQNWRQLINYVSVTPTVDTNIYASGDNIGGELTFSTAICGGISANFSVNSVVISDKAAQAVAYDVLLFKSNPSSTTFTDNAALDIHDSDLTKLLPPINILAADQFSFADNSVSSLSSLESGGFLSSTGGTLYGALVSRGTPTYASASDVTITLGIVCH